MAAINLSSWPARRASVAIATFLVAASALFYFYFRGVPHASYPHFQFGAVSPGVCDGVKQHSAVEKHVIPNIVHYVWLLKDPAEFKLGFKVFLSVYSAHIFWKPDTIYIHTDATVEQWCDAHTSGDVWTRRILSIPGVKEHHIVAPNTTKRGVRIVQMEHKADFLRMAVLRDFGGVYLDTDVVPLRDIAPLRNSGFATVLGGAVALRIQHTGYVNNGVMMSAKDSTLMSMYYHAAEEFFDGHWATASVHVLTDLANRLSVIPSEVLILQPQAFAPMSWEFEDQKRLFQPSLKSSTLQNPFRNISGPATPTCQDALAWLARRDKWTTEAEEMDFSSSYVLHAFDDATDKIWGWDHVVDVGYVLARQSNYARAVFPAVWHAVQAGIISQDETV